MDVAPGGIVCLENLLGILDVRLVKATFGSFGLTWIFTMEKVSKHTLCISFGHLAFGLTWIFTSGKSVYKHTLHLLDT